MTNHRVITTLESEHQIKHEAFSLTWKKRKVKLLGHIIRAHRYDPLRQVLYEKGTLIPRIEFKRRPGKPRANWLINTYTDAYGLIGGTEQFEIENTEHREMVHAADQARTGIFQTKPNKTHDLMNL